uniref:Uncharacterized protein n=1 Tax=Panagrolaimus davidi TaxID=227884 RepID=A0A914PDG5_9BILA
MKKTEQEKLHVIKIFQSGKLFNTVNIKPETCEYPIKTIPGEFYIVEYLIKDGSGKNTAEGIVKFRATFSKDEMSKLLKKAVDYVSVSCRTKMHPFRVLYRYKPQCYWDDIQVQTNNMMIKCIKDDNGQAANPTNENIFGLLFST